MQKLTHVLWLILVFSGVSQSKESDLLNPEYRFIKKESYFFINNDFTREVTTSENIKILSENIVDKAKIRSYSFSTSIEKFDIIEAYTLKEDGRRFDVPSNNYQVNINKGKESGGPVFSDRTTMKVIFPEVAAGDTLVIKTKLTETEPMFPGYFAESGYYWPEDAYDSAIVYFDLPETLDYQFVHNGMDMETDVKQGRKIIKLMYSNPKPSKSKRKNFSVWKNDDYPSYAISTFESYEAIALAYAKRALPKAEVTPRIKSLAKDILGKEKNSMKKAKLLYNWVAENISYAGNCIGVGAVVPRDIDFVLDTKMGDCKDHATLLQALYDASGIQSVQALINASNQYELPDVPLVTAVNHVINYLPEFNQYIDATNSAMPFESMSFAIADKPVLHIENYREGMRTPKIDPASNTQIIRSTIEVKKDGSIQGESAVQTEGFPAISMRNNWRSLSEDQEKEWVKNMFSSHSKVGFGKVSKDNPEPLERKFNYSFVYERPEAVLSKGAGGMYVSPPVYTPASISSYLQYLNEEIQGYSISCVGGTSTEQYTYQFDEGIRILAVPENLKINENNISYESSYKQDGRNITINRKINVHIEGSVCSPAESNRNRETFIKIADDLESQIVYQHYRQ